MRTHILSNNIFIFISFTISSALESKIRSIAISRKIHFTIITGTFGVTTLADINGIQQPIYLAYDKNNSGLIPAPKYFWKVLIDESNERTATAIVGINNPYANVKPEDIFCPDVCAQVAWIKTFKLTDIRKGFMFCCTVADLHKAIDYAPDLDLPLFV